MRLDLLRTSRSFALSLFATFTLSAATAVGCAANDGTHDDSGDGEASTSAITDVNESSVKRQSIGNCWIYASAGWAESLVKTGTGTELNISESYWTYWHWFDQIANGSSSGAKAVSTGGEWQVAADIMLRYGIMTEGDFIPSEATAEMSAHQASAESAINASLSTGALKTDAARKNRALVRKEMDKAWGLTAAVTTKLDKVFGASVSRTLDRSTVATTGTGIKRPKDLAIGFIDPATHTSKKATLADACGTKASSWSSTRKGALAWNEITYPSDTNGRRKFQERIQHALHDHQPVILSWFVDFNSLDEEGRFFEPPPAPGRQGGHMTVMYDYEIDGVPGFGTLKAGVNATPEQEQAALSDAATVHFFRVKNSWGSYRSDRAFTTPGYHDLYMAYLNGPVKECQVDANENPDPNNCSDATPLWGVVVPPGY